MGVIPATNTNITNRQIPTGAVPAQNTNLTNRQIPAATVQEPRTNPPVEQVATNVSNLTVSPRRTRPIRRGSYTIEEPKISEKVKILVGGTWRIIERKMLKASKKKPDTFIARIDERSVRLKPSQIAEYDGEDEKERGKCEKGKLFQVFFNGKYLTIPAESIEDGPRNDGFKIVTINGIVDAVHNNFIFPMEETKDGLQPTIPDFYRVNFPRGSVVVPKENIKPDETVRNTFMVLWNNVIYKLSAENLTPILPNETKVS
jgi:hypothetical protein